MEYLTDQKLENAFQGDSPMSDGFKPAIVIPEDWPYQQSIPEPDQVSSP